MIVMRRIERIIENITLTSFCLISGIFLDMMKNLMQNIEMIVRIIIWKNKLKK